MSLKSTLDKIKNKDIIFKKILPNNKFIPKTYKILNPYPRWVGKQQKWALFGIFTDLTIRKIIRSNFKNVIAENRLISEIAFDKIYGTESNSITNLSDISLNNDSEKIEEDFISFFKNALDWIQKYKDPDTTWQECLLESYYLSHLEYFIRNNTSLIPSEAPKDIYETKGFFQRIEKNLIDNIPNDTKIILNPIFGHNETYKADGDLIISNALFEIKTIKSIERYLIEDYYQLLSYISLYEWLKQKNDYRIQYLPKNIDEIGFFFPVQLEWYRLNISDWEITKRLDFLTLLKLIDDKNN